MPRFTRAQRRIFLGCLIAYGGAYLSRYNIAVALPDILAKLSLTDAQGGVLTTVFAIVYAAGQFVNGNLVDRVRWDRGVVDFLGPVNLGFAHFPIFNVADIAITCGAFARAFSFWLEERELARAREEAAEA